MKTSRTGPIVRRLAGALAFVSVFAIASHFASAYRAPLTALVALGGSWSIVAFVAITALFVVFVIPLDIVVLIPIGAQVFGPLPTALMSIVGWTLGSGIVFALARRYGVPFVAWLIGASRVERLRSRVPNGDLFWSVVLLRMLVPVDLLSYALGLFAPLSWGRYVGATALGVAPFGFYFAYVGTLPLRYQIGALVAALLFVGLLLRRRHGPDPDRTIA